ncbi:phenylalanine--tRNA ligase subunit beta [Syntrophotalea acetylenivorans]|uniref:Phenylalanine--tRNA ligase beta subunit n=1 Tax=Syntrophotalea acetylenivorans TaxID=1842532 RepID=A0A1L3GLL6_9BACT|nr:phenylalanine--tRNA ligase subunit beta [Syntrophotalea acetylenivorans]APG26814.1 phenylalanine--tRNA ligase subunit beta [Syntrophotalea acetylenivorans]
MIVSYNWLKEFVELDLTPEELSHRLTMAGLEVDAMDYLGAGLDTVIVARLNTVEQHPDADRLTLCEVDTGNDTMPVVCGATNHKVGDLIALAQVGSVLPGDFKIKKGKIRGQVSMGMLCSEKELGLADESAGIMILPAGLPLGQPVFEALGLKDVRYELGLTPNRPDCLSIVGVAREVAAIVGRPLQVSHQTPVENGEAIADSTSIHLEEKGLCPRYAARLIRGVKIGPSPEWLVRRLDAVGMRSINNVVDVTNLILMELGHPLHAFDFNLLRDQRIVVRRAVDGDSFTTLDGQERLLCSDDLVICDGQGPVALAGIMGGQNSEVGDETTDILLESAYFNPATIRRTSKRLGMHTEASHRFERGADVDMVPIALDKAASLIAEVAGGGLAKGIIDCYPEPLVERQITLDVTRANKVLGLKLASDDILGLLRAICLDAQPAADRDNEILYVKIPAFRPDLEREIDLIEEVARLHGYDQIPVTMPASRMICHRPAPQQRLVRRLRDVMVAGGFSETINYSFIAPEWDRLNLSEDDCRRQNVKILNPLSEDQSVMRTSLVPSMLESVSRNRAYRSLDLRLFELRPVFQPVDGEELPRESLRLCAAICGRREPLGWAQTSEEVDFFDLKGQVEKLMEEFRLGPISWDNSLSEAFYHPGKSCVLKSRSGLLGSIGEIHPQVLENFDIDQAVYLLDLDLTAFFSAMLTDKKFQSLSRFPDVCRDSALLVDNEISAEQVFAVIDQARGRFVEDFTLFDTYRGPGIPDDKKSLAIRVRYRSSDKTLTEEEITAGHERIIKALGKKLGAEIR